MPDAQELPPLIPRQILFGNPVKAGPQISPDGKYLTYLAPDEKNVLQVWLRTIGQADDRMLTADKKRGIRSYFWTYQPDQLIYMQDSDGDENFHPLAVNIQTNLVRDLTPFQGVKAEVVALSHRLPNVILVALNLRDRSLFDVYRVDLATGAVELEAVNPGKVVSWTADLRLKVRAASSATEDGGSDLLIRNRTDEPWKTARHWGPDESGGALLFSANGKTLYIVANHDANAERLIALNLASGAETVIAQDDQYDVGYYRFHPTKKTVQAVAFCRDRIEWQVLDRSVARDFKTLSKVRPGDWVVAGSDLANRTWVVLYVVDDGPTYYYLYDRAAKQATLLFSNQPKLEGLALSHMKPMEYVSRDGLTIHAYLSLPPGVAPKNLPAVLDVHGGPWARNGWGFNSTAQWLANRGYAVLQINYRGSTGYGKAFLNAGNRQWAGTMHDDLIDGVNWLIAQGIADPRRIAIMGGSYGGYATLVGLTFTPEVFACGVDLVGPSSIVTLIRSVPPYWKPMLKMFAHRVGDVDEEEEFLHSRSPLNFAGRIRRPLLIAQGANDPRVKQAESDQIVQVMRKANLPVEYVVYTDEGHGMARPENRLHFHALAEQFLAKHLGGRAEPVGEIPGHSAVIK